MEGLGVEEIPGPLAESEEFFSLLCTAHVLPPIFFTAAAATVVSPYGKSSTFGFRAVEC